MRNIFLYIASVAVLMISFETKAMMMPSAKHDLHLPKIAISAHLPTVRLEHPTDTDLGVIVGHIKENYDEYEHLFLYENIRDKDLGRWFKKRNEEEYPLENNY